MANYLGKLSDAILGAVDTGASIASNWMTKEAELLTEQKKSQLQLDVNAKINELSTNGKWQDWNTEITNFFQQKKSDMENPDSPYYCRNNLQAQMFDRLLNDSLVSVSNRVSQMSLQRQMQEMLAGNERAKENALVLGMSGLDYYEYANRLDQGADDFNALSPQERDLKRKQNFVIGYEKEIDNNFESEVNSVIDRDESFNSFYERIKSKSTLNGTKEGIDTTSIDTKKKKELEARYNAIIRDRQDNNAKELAQIYSQLTQASNEKKVDIAKMGQDRMNVMRKNDLSEDDWIKYSNLFKLSDPSISQSGAKTAFNKLDPKDAMNFFLNSIRRGDESDLGGPTTVYNSYELFKNRCMDELVKINPEYTYNELEMACPTVMEYLEYAKKSLPPMMQGVVVSAQNMLKSCLGDEEAKEEMDGVLDIVYDMLFEANISDFDAAQQKEYRDRAARAINSKYGSKLEKNKNYKWLKDETSITAITDYKKGVFKQEEKLAQAMQARDNNPDIYYKDMYGNKNFFMGEDVQNGLTLIENEEREIIADAIKYKTGKKIEPGEIAATYESDGVNDVNARNIYTVDGYDYYFTSNDGKHVTMYEKKTGSTEWHESKTKTQQEKYDSPRETAKRALRDIDVSKVPPFEAPGSGVIIAAKYSQEQWNEMSNTQKKNIIMSLLKKYPEEMQQWLDEQPDKTKK